MNDEIPGASQQVNDAYDKSMSVNEDVPTSSKNSAVNKAIKPQKKKILIIVASVFLLILATITTVFLLTRKNNIETGPSGDTSTHEDDNSNDSGEDIVNDENSNNTETVNTYTFGKDLDVSMYTDITLVDYDDLAVFISEKLEDDPSVVSGIVYYYPMSYFYNPEKLSFSERFPADGSFDTLYIVNKKNLTGELQNANYEKAFEDIKQKNTSADWFAEGRGYPNIFETSLSASPYYFFTEIDNIDYPGTDYTFAVLQQLDGEPTPADDSSYNGIISVFAIKGNNLISVEFDFNLIQKLKLTEEDSQSCAEMTTMFDSEENYLAYNKTCLATLFRSGKYDSNIQEFTNLSLEKFKILGQ